MSLLFGEPDEHLLLIIFVAPDNNNQPFITIPAVNPVINIDGPFIAIQDWQSLAMPRHGFPATPRTARKTGHTRTDLLQGVEKAILINATKNTVALAARPTLRAVEVCSSFTYRDMAYIHSQIFRASTFCSFSMQPLLKKESPRDLLDTASAPAPTRCPMS